MGTPLRVLMVEDSEDDALLVLRTLRRDGYDPLFERVDTPEAMSAALNSQRWDIIISDYSMPRFSGLGALQLLNESGLDLPFIIVSGTIGEDVAVAAMRSGAHDYVMKDKLARLVPAVRRELGEAQVRLARRKAEAALRESERQYRITLDSMGDAIHVVDADLRLILVNGVFERWNKVLGLETDVIGRNLFEIFPFLPEGVRQEYRRVFETGTTLVTQETNVVSGREVITETRKIPIIEEGRVDRVVTVVRDITQVQRAEQAVRDSEARQRALLSAVPDLIFQLSRDGIYLAVVPSPILEPVAPPDELIGSSVWDVLPPEVAGRRIDCIERALQTGEVQIHEYQLVQGGEEVHYEARVVASGDDNVLTIVRDITERVRAVEEKERFLKRTRRQHAALIRLASHPALSEGRLDKALRAITEVAAETLHVERVNVCKLSSDGFKVHCLDCFTCSSGEHTAERSFPLRRFPRYRDALENDRALVVADVMADPRTAELAADFWVPLGIGAAIKVPVRLHGKLVGVLCHEHAGTPRVWHSDEVNFAVQLADLVGQAFLTADLRRRADELVAITRVSREITSVTDLQQVFNSIALHAAELSQADASGVFAFRPDGRLHVVAGYGVGDVFIAAANAQGIAVGQGAVGRAVVEHHPVQILDTQTEPGYPFGRLAEMENIRGLLAVPMLREEEMIGGVVLWHRQPRHFAPEEVAFLEALAQQCVNAVENARLFEAEARRRREAETLRTATQALSATLDLQRVFELILSQLQQVVPYDSASVQQLKGANLSLELIGGHGFPNLEELLGVSFDLTAADNPNREVVRTRAPLILADAPTEYEAFKREPHKQAGIRSWLGVPLLFGDRLIGMIALDKRTPGFYTQEHARLALAFAAQAAIAVENARLFQEEQQRRREAEVLREASLALGATLEVDQVLPQLLDQIRRVIPYTGANVAFIENGVARVIHQQGYEQAGVGKAMDVPALAVEETPTLQRMFRTHRPHVVRDTRADPDWVYNEPSSWICSWVGAPIVAHNAMVGLFSLDSETPNFYDQENAELLAAFATHAAIAVENTQMFAELTRALEQQRELDHLKDQFIQNVSHELRTPLGLILGYAALLEEGQLGELQPDQQEPVAVIARRARMLRKLVDDLTAILETDAQKSKREPVDLAALAHGMLADFRAAAEQAGLTLKAQIAPDLPLVSGDPIHLRRVLDNLLGNALKFTPAGGQIAVRLGLEDQDLVLEVADTGVGIPSDQLERIFDRFYQVDGSMSRRYGGSGLGLALVKDIAKAHGGSVSVESQPGQGSTFRVSLPSGA